jgi:hypothetical protein
MDDVDDLSLDTIKNATRGNNQLPIRQAPRFAWNGARVGEFPKLLNGSEDLLGKVTRGCGVVQGDIIGNPIQLLDRRVSPDYFSHRLNRCFARTWVEVRPSWMALSPRAIPSSTRIRF